mmetsp:Transcript_14856/g.22005  ORF Transcript_14856/g.22005 Transcript_14856/m.22005 type:complete len:223 (+) Transcript_14856:179-847(+)
MDPHQDRNLSEHILKSHMLRRGDRDIVSASLSSKRSFHRTNFDRDRMARDSNVWYDQSAGILNKEFLRKYICFAKSLDFPELSEEAMGCITEAYPNMRQNQNRNMPITPRTLESIIRLACASAKMRLSTYVTECDVVVAMQLMNFAIFHTAGSPRKDLHLNTNGFLEQLSKHPDKDIGIHLDEIKKLNLVPAEMLPKILQQLAKENKIIHESDIIYILKKQS